MWSSSTSNNRIFYLALATFAATHRKGSVHG
jgi:hypothetical protein